jgi:hypothetical protein
VNKSTPAASPPATPPSLPLLYALLPAELLGRLWGPALEVARLIRQFRDAELTPRSAYDFEHRLSGLLRELGRVIAEWAYNGHEPQDRGLLPAQVRLAGVWYRRNGRRTANRQVATLFGTITLWRFLYRPVDELVPAVFPLEVRLGLEAARATPALADRVGQLAAHGTQRMVLEALRRDHGVAWSAHLLRKVTAAVAAGMGERRHEAQVAKLLGLLGAAFDSRGDRRPVLSVGRDGVFLPMRHDACYREGAVATASVFDRRGRRLGTVYLGRMPEEGQRALSDQLTSLIRDVLARWAGPLPRLAYVTDAGHHPSEYYERVLCKMADPRSPGRRLVWEWVLDYYHACQYVGRLSDVLFGEGREGRAWAAKMRRWLKCKPRGVHRVLHSAAALRNCRPLRGTSKAFGDAYNYLSRRIAHLDYHGYRNLRLPIGSGVTEACCKTVFTQRMKQSGMSWGMEGGQAVVDLRVLQLSGVWEAARDAYLQSRDCPELRTQTQEHRHKLNNAA